MKLEEFKENFIKLLSTDKFNPQHPDWNNDFFNLIIINFEEYTTHDNVWGIITIQLDEWLYSITAHWQADQKWRFAYEWFWVLNMVQVEPKEITITIYEKSENAEIIDIDFEYDE